MLLACLHACVLLQIVGAILGALLVAGLMPNTSVGMGDAAPGEYLSRSAISWYESRAPKP